MWFVIREYRTPSRELTVDVTQFADCLSLVVLRFEGLSRRVEGVVKLTLDWLSECLVRVVGCHRIVTLLIAGPINRAIRIVDGWLTMEGACFWGKMVSESKLELRLVS
jgi:hypothetical protein